MLHFAAVIQPAFKALHLLLACLFSFCFRQPSSVNLRWYQLRHNPMDATCRVCTGHTTQMISLHTDAHNSKVPRKLAYTCHKYTTHFSLNTIRLPSLKRHSTEKWIPPRIGVADHDGEICSSIWPSKTKTWSPGESPPKRFRCLALTQVQWRRRLLTRVAVIWTYFCLSFTH